MPKRVTVSPKLHTISWLIEKNDWSDAAFARKIGKHNRWFSEVKRGRNLPSPEEAAKMCDILGVEPEEILTEEADIAVVRELIGEKEKPTPEIGNGQMNDTMRRINEKCLKMSADDLEFVLQFIEKMSGGE